VIPIYGVISPRATMMSELSGGGTSLDRVQQALKQAAADPQIARAARRRQPRRQRRYRSPRPQR
jgi:hypothetical protein